MENRGILNWRKWSGIRKAQILGFLLGALLTVVIQCATAAHERVAQPSVFYSRHLFWGRVVYPGMVLCARFGWDWKIGAASQVTMPMFCAMVVANSLLLGVGAGALAWVTMRLRSG